MQGYNKANRVAVCDWHGEIDSYEIIDIKKRENGLYSCVYRNSKGDTEKQLVSEVQLQFTGGGNNATIL